MCELAACLSESVGHVRPGLRPLLDHLTILLVEDLKHLFHIDLVPEYGVDLPVHRNLLGH